MSRGIARESRFLGALGGWFSGDAATASASIGGVGVDRPIRGYTELSPGESGRVGSIDRKAASLLDDGKSFTLNFVDAGLADFIRIVFEEILHENVVVDSSLAGRVTVRTTSPVSKAAALDVVRSVLANNGATLNKSDGIYRIAASRSEGGATAVGERSVRIFSLSHIDADQARSALQPFGADQSRIASMPNSRVLVAFAADTELDRYQQVLATLDVDQLRDRSFSLVPLKEAGAVAVATELGTMFASSDSFQALPVERMNAVLLLGRSPSTIRRARDWIQHLDQAGQDQRRVHIYPVQNRRAGDLATILRDMLGSKAADTTSPTAPGLVPAVATGGIGSAASAGERLQAVSATKGSATGAQPATSGEASGIVISADTATNSLVVIASTESYGIVERAIRRLDVMPTQVLIEATIAEVTLNDNLRHGVRWYFETGGHGFLLSDKSGPSVGAVIPGFNYVFSVPGVRVVIDALEDLTDVDIISSPALTVLDNETATLKVGDQVPIATRSARSVLDPDAPVVNDIEMKDTGIILSVRPRVNASGLVQLDISQEISDVVVTTTSSIDSPTIRQRSITSSVVVKSGTEIVLGGLISTRTERTRAGVPLLKDIPLIGEVFTSQARRGRARTELLIMIRPVVLTSSVDVQAITQEIRARIMDGPRRR